MSVFVDPVAQGGEYQELLLSLLGWQRTSERDRARVGIHTERGPESSDLTFRLYAGHDIFHINQARKALEQVRAR